MEAGLAFLLRERKGDFDDLDDLEAEDLEEREAEDFKERELEFPVGLVGEEN